MEKKTKILVEMRPALEGFAGIPQEVRLLFRGLARLQHADVEGMIQTSNRFLSAGLSDKKAGRTTQAKAFDRYSKVIVSLAEQPHENVLDRVSRYFRRRMSSAWLSATTSMGLGNIKLTRFDSSEFSDFTWRSLFAKSLPAKDFDAVAFSRSLVGLEN